MNYLKTTEHKLGTYYILFFKFNYLFILIINSIMKTTITFNFTSIIV